MKEIKITVNLDGKGIEGHFTKIKGHKRDVLKFVTESIKQLDVNKEWKL